MWQLGTNAHYVTISKVIFQYSKANIYKDIMFKIMDHLTVNRLKSKQQFFLYNGTQMLITGPTCISCGMHLSLQSAFVFPTITVI